MSHQKTYRELAEEWNVDKKFLYQAKTANDQILIEGEHYTIGEKGEYLWNPSGQSILAQALNIEYQPPSAGEPPEQDPTQAIATSISDRLGDALADPIALQVWQQLPWKVMHSMRRMLHAPASEAEAQAVNTALTAFTNAGTLLPALPNSQGED